MKKLSKNEIEIVHVSVCGHLFRLLFRRKLHPNRESNVQQRENTLSFAIRTPARQHCTSTLVYKTFCSYLLLSNNRTTIRRHFLIAYTCCVVRLTLDTVLLQTRVN